jgi:hypothetical protein
MPSVSKAQQHYMGMKYGEAKAGKKTGMDMTKSQLKDFAATKTKGLPGHVKDGKATRGKAVEARARALKRGK